MLNAGWQMGVGRMVPLSLPNTKPPVKALSAVTQRAVFGAETTAVIPGEHWSPDDFTGIPAQEASVPLPRMPPTTTNRHQPEAPTVLRTRAPPGGHCLQRHDGAISQPPHHPKFRVTQIFMFSLHIPTGLNKCQPPHAPPLPDFSLQLAYSSYQEELSGHGRK